MDVLITRSTAVKGQHLEAGETHSLANADAATLISMGKAVKAADAPACPPKPKAKAKKPKAVTNDVTE